MGQRLLRKWLLFPLTDPDLIKLRQEAISELIRLDRDEGIFKKIKKILN
jgi:DNA mismatch repair ATPase MutS